VAKLPDADRATIPKEKLYDYALAPDHPTGRHKARVFRSALGIDRDNWEYLRDQIVAGIQDAEVSEVKTASSGFQYGVPMLIEGLNGETHEVLTAWIRDSETDPPRLITLYVDVP
jgi:uncharacterized protein